jgi:hypothetical protein
MKVSRRQLGRLALAGLASRGGAVPSRPKLLVLVVLEHLRPDYLDTAWTQFGQGGIRKILGNAAYFPQCHNLASTFSSSGIATLATGAWPAQHGIVADGWYDRASRKTVTASGEMLLATTLMAQAAAAPTTRSWVVARTASRAALFAGTADAHLYWTDERGFFTTPGNPPDWIADFNRTNPPETAHNAHWMAIGAKPDAPPLRILSFDPDRPQEYMAVYRASPFGQRAPYDFLGELLERERLGQGDDFDFVCLLDDSTELLGYETGARSPLMEQMILHLDRRLEALVAQLGHAPGEGAFDLVLAAVHGAPPQPPTEARARMAVNGEALAQAVDRSLAAGGSGHVERYVYPFLYLDTGALRDPEPIRLAAGRAALQQAPVAGYFTAGGACSVHDGWERRYRNSFHPRRSGDVMLSYRPEYVEDYGQNRGISYGSLYNYDARVPLCFYGPQFRAGVFEAPVELVDVAPTLARAMGVAEPSSSQGRVLGEAFGGGQEPAR